MNNKVNALTLIPEIIVPYNKNNEGLIVIKVENKGVFNTIAQTCFNRPRYSYITLDNYGSFIWNEIEKGINIESIGINLKENFSDSIEPLYERLTIYIKTLIQEKFIRVREDKTVK